MEKFSSMNYETVKKIIIKRLSEELCDTLHYHNVEHTLHVIEAAEKIAIQENLGDDDIILVKTAALFHDSGFLLQYDQNEVIGCEISKEILTEYGYSDINIEKISNMIMATAIPQAPKNKLDEILCDADLDYLGGDDFIQISNQLRSELKEKEKNFTEKEWLTFEIAFLEKHTYFTKYSQAHREEQKQKRLNDLKHELLTL